jgi:predicted nucleotidyltransferase
MIHMYKKSYEKSDFLIIEELSKGENHIRELARRTKLKPMTIKRELDKLIKENIVDFSSKGRNKVFFLKESFESLNMRKIIELRKRERIVQKYPSLRKIFKEIERNKKINLAIMFGSYAKGLESNKSDIDIYLENKNQDLKKELERIDSRISVKSGKFDKRDLLIKEIIKNHIIIKGVDKYYEKNKS